MSPRSNDPLRALVVDPRREDYRDLQTAVGRTPWEFEFLATARAALRAPSASADLWLVNIRLPDMPGFELFEILRDRDPAVRAYLVADHYCVDDERRACLLGSPYLCKSVTGTISCDPLLMMAARNRPPSSVNTDGAAPHSRRQCAVPAPFASRQFEESTPSQRTTVPLASTDS